MTNTQRYLISIFAISAVAVLLNILTQDLFLLSRIGVSFLAMLGVVYIVFELLKDRNAPAQLNSEQIKSFFKSKIFWLAFVNLIITISKGLFGFEIDAEGQTEIVNMDWTNIGQALLSVGVLAIRKFDILKVLF